MNYTQLEPVSYANLDLVYDVKSYEQVIEVLITGCLYGEKLSYKRFKQFKDSVKELILNN